MTESIYCLRRAPVNTPRSYSSYLREPRKLFADDMKHQSSDRAQGTSNAAKEQYSDGQALSQALSSSTTIFDVDTKPTISAIQSDDSAPTIPTSISNHPISLDTTMQPLQTQYKGEKPVAPLPMPTPPKLIEKPSINSTKTTDREGIVFPATPSHIPRQTPSSTPSLDQLVTQIRVHKAARCDILVALSQILHVSNVSD